LVVLPTDSEVLISTSCLKMRRAISRVSASSTGPAAGATVCALAQKIRTMIAMAETMMPKLREFICDPALVAQALLPVSANWIPIAARD